LDQPLRYNGTEEIRMAAGTYFGGLNNNYIETPLISFKTYFVFQPAGGVYDASFTITAAAATSAPVYRFTVFIVLNELPCIIFM
jgi:hypothetical protein